MALNIPVNLMNTTVPPTQSADAKNTANLTAIQPTAGNTDATDARGTASDGMNRGSSEQLALIFQQRTTQAPDKADPKSVVTAQTQSDGQEPKQAVTEVELAKIPTPDTPRQSELDRYAPPNPLPTAPILQLAASYAALTAQDT